MAFFRRIVEDYEARLAPPESAVPRGTATGKAEHERFEDGEVQFEVGARGLDITDGAELDIQLNGEPVARVTVKRGGISLRLSNQGGHGIPAVRAGDRLEVTWRSVVLLLGTFAPD